MNFALILAGGVGKRAGGLLPKQFQSLDGKPVLWWSMEAFKDFHDTHIVLVLHPDFYEDWEKMISILQENEKIKYYIASGGVSRIESVRNGLEYIKRHFNPSDNAIVCIHDGARPLVSPDLILRGLETVEKGKGAVPVVALSDSIRRKMGQTSVAADRSEFLAVQTPQIFHFNEIYDCYAKIEESSSFTDDASVAESAGMLIKTFEGDAENIKITNPADFSIAAVLLERNRKKDS